MGYARVSRSDQILVRQINELQDAGCDRIFTEKASGSKDSKRPEFDLCLRMLRPCGSLDTPRTADCVRSRDAQISFGCSSRNTWIGYRGAL
ncbi:recombinase family protein [Arthrobacter sp. B10-11]|uniref:recombinase family protein n=1 Tax=Arthrobacter sp. B10-11 TaxID=3081160 RepID=UPI0029549889|nr:recombinase family protein [Arthrobacter sp. B10-11]MDV8149727.1 recombinase family protein [Arthrobacter sp. B10-11]